MHTQTPTALNFHASRAVVPNQGCFRSPLPRGHLAMSGDIFYRHGLRVVGIAAGICSVDAAKHPAMHSKAPTSKTYLIQVISSAEVEDPSFKRIIF